MRANTLNNDQQLEIAQGYMFSDLYDAIKSYEQALKEQPTSEFGFDKWRINSIPYLERIYKTRTRTALLCSKALQFFGCDFLSKSADRYLSHIGKTLPSLPQSTKIEFIYQHFDIIISVCFKNKHRISEALNITAWNKYFVKSLLEQIPCHFEFFHSHVAQPDMRNMFLQIITKDLECIAKTGLLELQDESPFIIQQYLLNWSVMIEQMPTYYTRTNNDNILKVMNLICAHLGSIAKFKPSPPHITMLQHFLLNTTFCESLFTFNEGCDSKPIEDRPSLEMNQLIENRNICLARAIINIFNGTPQYKLRDPTGIAAKLNNISFICFILRLHHKFGRHDCQSVEKLEQIITTALLTFIDDLPIMDANSIDEFCKLLAYMHAFSGDYAEKPHYTLLRSHACLERRLFAVTVMALDLECQRHPYLLSKISTEQYLGSSAKINDIDERVVLFAPNIIHFIWIGKPIPEKYLRSILSLNAALSSQRQDRIQIIIWCDTKTNIYRTANQMEIFNIPKQILTKTFKDDLLPKMELDDFYTSSPEAAMRLQQFKFFTKLETMGAYNYATVSDLFRLEILRLFGGCYCDTDTEFDPPKHATGTIREKLPFGFRVNIKMHETAPVDAADRIIKAFKGIKSNGNDIMVAVPNCHFIINALVMTLQYLHTLHSQSMQKYSKIKYRKVYCDSIDDVSEFEIDVPLSSMYDVKRCNRSFSWKYNKRKLSIQCGPGIVRRCLEQFIPTELDKIDVGKNTVSIAAFREVFACVTVGSPIITVFGIRMKSKSDLNWLRSADNTLAQSRPRSYTV